MSKICAVSSSSVALKEDGTVWTWGDNYLGQLGMSGGHRSIPTKTSIEGIKDVYCGFATVYAIKEDNTVLSWGVDNNGQLGAGVVLNTRSNSEHVVGGESGESILSNIKSMSADYTEAAVTFDGEVYSWGSNSKGQHGNGTVKTAWLHNSSPRKSIIDNVSHVSVKYEHALAVKTDGTLYSWGSNSSGQLFLGDTLDRHVPVETGITDVHQVALTGNSSHIVKKDGTVWSVGGNSFGQLGNGTEEPSLAPIQAINADGTPFTLFEPKEYSKLLEFESPHSGEVKFIGQPMNIKFSAVTGEIDYFDIYYAYSDEIEDESKWISITSNLSATEVSTETKTVDIEDIDTPQTLTTYEYIWENTPNIPTEEGRSLNIIIIPSYTGS